MNGKQKFYILLISFQFVLIFIVIFSVEGIITFVSAQTTPSSFDYYNSTTAAALAIGAGISVGFAVIGSGMALKTVGTAAISSLTEREETFFKAFLVAAFCEALAIYGMIVAILLWTKIPNLP